MHPDAHVRAGRRVDVAAVLFHARCEAERFRIAVFDVDARDARGTDHGDRERLRRDGSRDDAIAERRGQGVEREREAPRCVARASPRRASCRRRRPRRAGAARRQARDCRPAAPRPSGSIRPGRARSPGSPRARRATETAPATTRRTTRGPSPRTTKPTAANRSTAAAAWKPARRSASEGTISRGSINDAARAASRTIEAARRWRVVLTLRGGDVDGAHQTLVEVRLPFFDESRDARVRRRLTDWPVGPDDRRHDSAEPDDAEARRARSARGQPPRNEQDHGSAAVAASARANRRLKRHQPAPARTDASSGGRRWAILLGHRLRPSSWRRRFPRSA